MWKNNEKDSQGLIALYIAILKAMPRKDDDSNLGNV